MSRSFQIYYLKESKQQWHSSCEVELLKHFDQNMTNLG